MATSYGFCYACIGVLACITCRSLLAGFGICYQIGHALFYVSQYYRYAEVSNTEQILQMLSKIPAGLYQLFFNKIKLSI